MISLSVSKKYGDSSVFDNFALQIKEGEILCLLGASGVGKTTLLNILAGLTDFQGNIENLPEKIGYIFQEPRLIPNLTVEENLRYAGGEKDAIEEILQKTGLLPHKNKRPSMLSGGEKQRVNLARAFLSGAKLLLFDEAFSSLDLPLKKELYELFLALWEKEKPTVVLVTHDIDEAWALGDRILLVKEGKVILERIPKRERKGAFWEYDKGKEALVKRILEESNEIIEEKI